MFVTTNCDSFTGRFIYSDCYSHRKLSITPPGLSRLSFPSKKHVYPILNWIALVPIIGGVAGIVRFVLAIFHTIGHLFAALLTWNKGHLAHSLKGCSEMLRGVIETIPIAGQFFAWAHVDIDRFLVFEHVQHFASFFLMKLYNPKKIDAVDAVFAIYQSHPLLKVPEEDIMNDKAVNMRTNTPDIEITRHYTIHKSFCSVIQRIFSHETRTPCTRASWVNGI